MMCTLKETKYSLTNISTNYKVTAVELALQESLTKIQELVMDYEQLKLNYNDYESQYLTQKEKCDSKTCSGSLELKKVNDTKDNIIQSIASAVTKLYETRDFNTINEIFSIICGESSPESNKCRNINKHDNQISPIDLKPVTKDQGEENKTAHDESVSEIEGTPTGRTSPIILNRKSRNTTNLSSLRDKKKCPTNWPSPDTKAVKLSFPTPTRIPNGRLKQTRLDVVKLKPTCLIDLTSSPELKSEKILINPIQLNVKQEDLDDETILPSPNGLVTFHTLQKSLKSSPSKFKKPSLSLKLKLESARTNGRAGADENVFNDIKNEHDGCQSPAKLEIENCKDADESMSLLRQVCKFEAKGTDGGRKTSISPNKRPLAENHNAVNVQHQFDSENSISILKNNSPTNLVADENLKRTKNMEPAYKEPTVRKRSEKRALPGWSCEECRQFYDELYKDKPEMLAKKMEEECSKHRSRFNPVRPKTPPGYWNPRWDVPTDTEEFNRRNNAL